MDYRKSTEGNYGGGKIIVYFFLNFLGISQKLGNILLSDR